MLAKQQNVVVNVALPTNISQEIINKKGKEDNFKFPTMFSQCSYQENNVIISILQPTLMVTVFLLDQSKLQG